MRILFTQWTIRVSKYLKQRNKNRQNGRIHLHSGVNVCRFAFPKPGVECFKADETQNEFIDFPFQQERLPDNYVAIRALRRPSRIRNLVAWDRNYTRVNEVLRNALREKNEKEETEFRVCMQAVWERVWCLSCQGRGRCAKTWKLLSLILYSGTGTPMLSFASRQSFVLSSLFFHTRI